MSKMPVTAWDFPVWASSRRAAASTCSTHWDGLWGIPGSDEETQHTQWGGCEAAVGQRRVFRDGCEWLFSQLGLSERKGQTGNSASFSCGRSWSCGSSKGLRLPALIHHGELCSQVGCGALQDEGNCMSQGLSQESRRKAAQTTVVWVPSPFSSPSAQDEELEELGMSLLSNPISKAAAAAALTSLATGTSQWLLLTLVPWWEDTCSNLCPGLGGCHWQVRSSHQNFWAALPPWLTAWACSVTLSTFLTSKHVRRWLTLLNARLISLDSHQYVSYTLY